MKGCCWTCYYYLKGYKVCIEPKRRGRCVKEPESETCEDWRLRDGTEN